MSASQFVGRRIAELREQRGLDHLAFSKRAGIPAADIAAYEAGEVRVPPVILSMIATALGVGIAAFYQEPKT